MIHAHLAPPSGFRWMSFEQLYVFTIKVANNLELSAAILNLLKLLASIIPISGGERIECFFPISNDIVRKWFLIQTVKTYGDLFAQHFDGPHSNQVEILFSTRLERILSEKHRTTQILIYSLDTGSEIDSIADGGIVEAGQAAQVPNNHLSGIYPYPGSQLRKFIR